MNHIPLSKSEKMKCGYLTKAVCLTLDGLPNTVTAQITPVFYERREPQKRNDDSSIDQSITELIFCRKFNLIGKNSWYHSCQISVQVCRFSDVFINSVSVIKSL